MFILQNIIIVFNFYLIYINHNFFISCAFVCRKQYAFPYIINNEKLNLIEKDVNEYIMAKNQMLLINDDCDIRICYEITKETNLKSIKDVKKEQLPSV